MAQKDKEKIRQKQNANLKPAKRGEVRNPLGSSVPKEIRDLRQYTNIDVERKLHTLLQMTPHVLKERLEHPETKTLEKLVGVILWKAIANGCTTRGTWILDRAGCRLPPMVQPIALSITAQVLKDMPQGELIDLGTQAIRVLEEVEKAKTIGVDDEIGA